MSYTPINLTMFIAAYSGTMYGMTANNAALFDATVGDYASAAIVAGAFAQACDIAWNNSATPDQLEVQQMQSSCTNYWIGRTAGPATTAAFELNTNWTVPADAIVALIKASEAYMSAQGITPPTWNTGGASVTWSDDLAGSTNTVQRVVALSGAELIPLIPTSLGGTEIAAWGGISGLADAALWLGTIASGVVPSTTNWSISSDGVNTIINAPAGQVKIGAAGTAGNVAVLSQSVAEISGALQGIAAGSPLATADSSVTLAATGTTALTSAQQQTPSLTVAAVSIGGAGATLNFGNVGGGPGTSSAVFYLDLSNVTTGGNGFTIENGSASVNIASFISNGVPQANLFVVKCNTNHISFACGLG